MDHQSFALYGWCVVVCFDSTPTHRQNATDEQPLRSVQRAADTPRDKPSQRGYGDVKQRHNVAGRARHEDARPPQPRHDERGRHVATHKISDSRLARRIRAARARRTERRRTREAGRRPVDDALLARTVRLLLRLLATIIVAVTVVCFAQSYRQLLDWATRHRIPLWIAPAWPIMLDAFIIVGEIVLFISIVRDWPKRTRVLAWGMSIAGLVASVAAQWLYLPDGASWWDRGTAVVAPLGATLGLAAGLVVLKWVAADARNRPARTESSRNEPAQRVTDRPADELAQRRTGKRHDVAGARAAIADGRAAGKTPSAYSIAMRYLGGDAATRRRGDERLAKQLLGEGAR